jgi:hypothetical protein
MDLGSGIPDPGVKKALIPDPGYRIPDPDPQHWFLGLQDPDPLVRGTDPDSDLDPDQAPAPSIIKQKP